MMIPIQVTIKQEQFNAFLHSQERIALAIERLAATDQPEIDELVSLQAKTKAKLQALLDSATAAPE